MSCGIFLLVSSGILHAQDAVPASGGDASGAGGSLSYTVGQVVYTSNSSATGSTTLGVQQTYTIISDVGLTVENIALVSTYPNPTTNFITLSIEDQDLTKLSYQLFDVTGKLLQKEAVTATTTTIEMASLKPATYILKVMEESTTISEFKIVKN